MQDNYLNFVYKDLSLYETELINTYNEKYPYKGSSTKRGNNPKDIAKRRKRNKNKKTHRR